MSISLFSHDPKCSAHGPLGVSALLKVPKGQVFLLQIYLNQFIIVANLTAPLGCKGGLLFFNIYLFIRYIYILSPPPPKWGSKVDDFILFSFYPPNNSVR